MGRKKIFVVVFLIAYKYMASAKPSEGLRHSVKKFELSFQLIAHVMENVLPSVI